MCSESTPLSQYVRPAEAAEGPLSSGWLPEWGPAAATRHGGECR